MTTEVPALDRAGRILAHLATRPTSRPTMSELSAALGIGKGTIHSILSAMHRQGLVAREDTTKRYRLGVFAFELFGAAQQQFAGIEPARAELYALSRDTGLPGIVSGLCADEIVVLATAGRPRMLGADLRLGWHTPYAPPVGLVFAAWGGDAGLERWISGGGATNSSERVHELRMAAAAARSRGYTIGLDEHDHDRSGVVLARLAESTDRDERIRLAVELADVLAAAGYAPRDRMLPARAQVGYVAAPVFSPAGDLSVALSLFVPDDQLEPDAVEQLGRRVAAAADSVTAAIGGGT